MLRPRLPISETYLMISPTLLDALVAADFAQGYYKLCAAHESIEKTRCSCPNAEIIATLRDLGQIKKERGPGRVYTMRAPAQHARLVFDFGIKGEGTYIEPTLRLSEGDAVSGSSFSVLASYAHARAGCSPVKPPFPRPTFSSLYEMRQIVEGCLGLTLKVGHALAP